MYTTSELIGLIRNAAARYGIDPNVAVAQLERESAHFNPYYVYGPGKSPAGAMGVAQFMPGTWAMYGNGSPYDPHAALEAWGRYMSHLLSIFGGRYDLALAGYNWGENRTALRNALSAGRSVLEFSIPSETRNYVSGILGSGARNIFSSSGSVAVNDLVDPFDFGSDYQPVPYALPPVGGTSGAQVLIVVAVVLVGWLVIDSLRA